MQMKEMLLQMLNKNCPQIHTCRLTALMDGVELLVYDQTLTLTDLGRSLLREISIKQSYRLIGNANLYEERQSIYQTGFFIYTNNAIEVDIRRQSYGKKTQSRHSKKNAQGENTPWLLVSSLGKEDASAKQVIQLYRTRMQIEEGFRDIKNQRTDFALFDTRTRSPKRLANLLLVGMLTMLVVWLMGRLAEEQQLHYHYQANTIKKYRVLSLFYLACLLVVQRQFNFTKHELQHAINLVQQDMLKQWES